MIGATSDHTDDINGAVVNVRNRGDKICKFHIRFSYNESYERNRKSFISVAVWTADCQNRAAITGIGLELKKYLGTDAKISYEMHNASKSSKPLLML